MVKYFLFFCIILTAGTVEAQRFNAGLVFGLNAAQLNGDFSAGFNRFGIHGGLRATTYFTDKFEMALEMLYSQRGSRYGFISRIRTNYVEIPVMACYKDWYHEQDDYYKMDFSAGLTYGYLISTKLEATAYQEVFLNKHDVGFLAGATFNFNKHWGIGVRYTRSITYLFNPEKQPLNENALLGYFLSFRVRYML